MLNILLLLCMVLTIPKRLKAHKVQHSQGSDATCIKVAVASALANSWTYLLYYTKYFLNSPFCSIIFIARRQSPITSLWFILPLRLIRECIRSFLICSVYLISLKSKTPAFLCLLSIKLLLWDFAWYKLSRLISLCSILSAIKSALLVAVYLDKNLFEITGTETTRFK